MSTGCDLICFENIVRVGSFWAIDAIAWIEGAYASRSEQPTIWTEVVVACYCAVNNISNVTR
jgi:hypothetical protein